MKLRTPYFKDNFSEDQPYDSLILIAPYCDFSCKGCQNIDLFKSPIKDYDISVLAEVILENPFVSGITVGGLEVLKSGMNFMLDLGELIKLANISRVTIYSRFELDDENLFIFLEKIKDLECVTELYCKTGEYIEGLGSKISNFYYKGNPWSICLGSKNQDFNIIKGNELIKLTVNDDCLK